MAIHATETAVKQHPLYESAKGGDIKAARQLASDSLNENMLRGMADHCAGLFPRLIAVHALERHGVNAIPAAFAFLLSARLGWEVELDVIQANVVNHTGASGFARLARQALFDGNIAPGNFVLVDDFIGQGGTIANLRGHLMRQGGTVVYATVLTGKPHSAPICQARSRLDELRAKHGDLETWWTERFGFGFDCLTASETRYLIGTPDGKRIQERLDADGGQGGTIIGD